MTRQILDLEKETNFTKMFSLLLLCLLHLQLLYAQVNQCALDSYEPNNSFQSARHLTLSTTTTISNLTLCTGVDSLDFFSITGTGERLLITLEFLETSSSAVDADLFVYNNSYGLIAFSTGVSGFIYCTA